MRKVIHRRLEFSVADIKQALLMWLKERDHPYPNGAHNTEEFKLLPDGAELSWSEDCEV